MILQERYLRDKQSLWSCLMIHIDSDVDHLIKLHPDYSQAAQNLDSNILWNIFRQSVNQNGIFTNVEKKIEWANYSLLMINKVLL